MGYLLLASCCSIAIIVIFKLFNPYKIDGNQAIVVNYITCAITGCVTLGGIPFEAEMIYAPWVPIMIFLGFLFMGGFNLVNLIVKHFGVAISTVSQRMSLGISVPFSIWFYQENYTYYKVIGIIIALLSVLLINIREKEEQEEERGEKKRGWLLFLPILIWTISAIIEITLQYLHSVHSMLPAVESIVLFSSASIVGIGTLIYALITRQEFLKKKNIVAGVILGVPNYFSIYFMLCAMDSLNGSTVFALSNIIIVSGAALIGLWKFKEKLSTLNLVGIGFALLAVFLITQ